MSIISLFVNYNLKGGLTKMSNSKKWPFGFYVCSLTFTFERLAYYAGKWGIGVFPVIAAAEGGLGLSTAEGAVLSSYFVA